jgi:hypothetical protein
MENMKIFKWSVILLALLLAAMAMVPMVSAANSGTAPSGMVSIDDAKSIALTNIHDIATTANGFSDWLDSDVVFSMTYYDLSAQPTAYAFNMMRNGVYNGYVLISAQRNNYPVLECSKGHLPLTSPEANSESRTEVSMIAQGKGMKTNDPIPVYLGATFYLLDYPLTDKNGKTVDHAYIDLTNHKKINLTDLSKELAGSKADAEKWQTARKAEIKKLWDLQEPSARASLVSPLLRSSNYVYDVPFYQWQSGCSPTAAGMVLGYWGSHGYPNYPVQLNLVAELATAMGTSSTWPFNGATWPLWIDDGIETVARNHGYTTLDSVENIWLSGDHFEEMVGEIDAGRPFVLSLAAGGAAVGKPTAYGQHSVTGVGYVRAVQNFVTIHDTWNNPPNYPLSEDRLIANNNWVAAMSDWVRP